MRQIIVTAILVLVLVSAIATGTPWPNQGADNQVVASPGAISSVIQDLAPGDTLHIVTLSYRRGGPMQLPAAWKCQTGWSRHETWASFGDDGRMVGYNGEARAEDGTLCGTSALEGDDLVYRDADGKERESFRLKNFRLSPPTTVQATKDNITQAIAQIADNVAAHPDAPTIMLGSEQVLFLEDREPFSPPAAEATPAPMGDQRISYRFPYVSDLRPTTEKIRRQYILPDVNFLARSETIFVAEDGTETVVEALQFQVLEILKNP